MFNKGFTFVMACPYSTCIIHKLKNSPIGCKKEITLKRVKVYMLYMISLANLIHILMRWKVILIFIDYFCVSNIDSKLPVRYGKKKMVLYNKKLSNICHDNLVGREDLSFNMPIFCPGYPT